MSRGRASARILRDIKLDANGGSVSPTEVSIVYEDEVGALPTPTRTGYTFAGWFDAEGKPVTSETKMTMAADVTLSAQWTANKYAVKFDANGGEGAMADRMFVYDRPQALKPNAFERKAFDFIGWATSADGNVDFDDIATIDNLFAEDGATLTLYAVWERCGISSGETKVVADESTGATTEIVVLSEDEPAFDGDAAAVYDGFVVSADGNVVGTVQVKAAKANKKTGVSNLTATMQLVGEKKLSFKGGEWGPESEYAEMALKDGRTLVISIGKNGLVGTFGEYEIDGARNIFSAKDAKTMAAAVENAWVGAVNVVGGDVALAVAIAKKGKVKSYTVNMTGVMLGDKALGTATLKKPAVSFPIAIE